MKVVDMHCDTIGAIFEKRNKGIACNLRKNDLHLDVNKMEQGNYLMQNFAMFIDLKRYKNPYLYYFGNGSDQFCLERYSDIVFDN